MGILSDDLARVWQEMTANVEGGNRANETNWRGGGINAFACVRRL
jgi:hypothetical protein